MLNQDTKRRIDSARDILVGKVPDPKAQVEQITTALIYKFMDDIDNESEELGGKARFFVGDYEKYAWSKLLDARLGGIERLNLYTEALIKLPQNPTLPQLFRDILKDAFLPYRDPETLNLFLKEINSFTYDHSEKLGDAFEYLLSIMGSQGDAGQFRTPRHIIDFIVEVMDPKKEETILDPACGTAGFLISAYKHILRENGVRVPGDQLTPDQRTKLMTHFIGYDISPDMVRMSLVNMYLHSFPNPRIYEYDTLTSEERWNETYDVIMANPPFMSPKGGIRPHKRFSIQANRSEVLFVDYIAEHLTIHGRAGVIVPEGIIFQSGTAYKALRKMLVEKYLYAVVSLPGGIFQPYSGVKTSILLMDKNLAKKTDSILFVKVENDGFDLGAQRRAIDKNDLTQALVILQRYKQAVQNGEDPNGILDSSALSKMAVIAEKSQIAKNGDFNLSSERHRRIKSYSNSEWPKVKLGELITINNGQVLTDFDAKGIACIKVGDMNLHENQFEVTTSTHWTQKELKGLLEVGSVIFPKRGAAIATNKKRITKVPCYIDNNCMGLTVVDKTQLNSYYLYYLLQGFDLSTISNSAGVALINNPDIRSVEIPLPLLEIQQKIVAELDGYQKIIDGARQVVESYRPEIIVDPKWQLLTLGEIAQVDGEILLNPLTQINEIHIGGENIEKDTGKLIDLKTAKEKNIRGPVCVFHSGQILYNKVRPYLNKAALPAFDGICSSDMYPLTICDEKVSNKYLFYYLLSKRFNESIKPFYERARMPKINREQLYAVLVPLPSRDIQEQIVTQLEEEQKLVHSNKRLIEIFEQKIKDKIAEVWGEETTEFQQSDLIAVS